MNAFRTLPVALLGAALLLVACGPRHAQVARGGAATAPPATVAPSPSATPSPTVDASTPTAAPATPTPTPVPTPRPPTAPPAPPPFTVFPLPNTSRPGYTMAPAALIAGADGNLWWVDANSDAVGRTTPRGVTTVFRIPGGTQPRPELAAAPDGTLWGADFNNMLLHITVAGAVTEVDPGAPMGGNGPYHLAVEPDGTLWFVGGSPLALFHRDLAGTTTTVSLDGAYPVSLTWGPDHALWFGETISGGEGVARLDPTTDAVAHYAVPGPPDFVGPLVAGPDGNLWFGENTRAKVGRITPQGVIADFAVPSYGGRQLTVGSSLVLGHDGALWAAAAIGGHSSIELVRFTLAGAAQVVTVTGVGGAEAYVYNLAEGPDGHLWTLLGNGYQASTGVSALVRDNRA